MDIRVNSHVEGGCNEGFGEIDHLRHERLILGLKWFLHSYKGLLVDQEKESMLVESQKKEDHINTKGAFSLAV